MKLLRFLLIAATSVPLLAQGTPNDTKTPAAPYRVDDSSSNWRVLQGTKLVFDAAADAKAEWARLLKVSSPGTALDASYSYRLLSLVGPYLSLEKVYDCDCGGAHPSSVTRFVAFNLEERKAGSPRQASLEELFPAESIRRALSVDRAVAKALDGKPAASPLPALIEQLNGQIVTVESCAYAFSGDQLMRFAIFDITADAHVSVRLSLSHASEVCRGQITQLGLILPISEPSRQRFQPVGFLMKNKKRPLATFSFSRK